MQGESKAYPGEVATPNDIRQLADEYRGVAHDLMGRGKRGNPSSWAPARMTAIQAIELYLNALLLARGVKPAEIRGYQHDLRKRTANPAVSALRLRQRTLDHLGKLSEGREYLSIRYGPELSGDLSQLNRLMATLDEVAIKVAGALDKANAAPATAAPPARPGPSTVPARGAAPVVTSA
ncbi:MULTISPECIES: hypothetical protein [Sphingobium]|uniref:HEPN domain-containing protein n=1 Tax=Sphingobium fuliginis (strain ATCC 27551) TaxID=336203 RepID=A0A292ZP81_SPHSA|nr:MULTISPECIES: hypothetical protein [Sphingobium]OAP29825.1 hypothetical protein A8O16_21560 [Sphingobium sp. 20006FA]KXU30190.1 hypothetical protein AXW74_18965 [Sphingobium sp. AM]KYC30275.1 hypothetical protein A0J57_21360 [Sphingobium sp. 22B]MCB4861875.1 hypothetical protein [Sphingobium sp. PNB]MEC6701496.1 hypothetical protein [Sphingobium sp. SJ10-10]